jgi:hypothetical protein
MAYSSKTFEVALENEKAVLAFGLRLSVADFIRSYFRKGLDRAEDAEIDKPTALRRASLNYAAAARGYRLLRAVPATLVNWCGTMEMSRGQQGFIEAGARTLGTFDRSAVRSLPGGVILAKLGGIEFAGACESGVPNDLIETRVTLGDDGKYHCTLISGGPDSGYGADETDPVEPEMEDA